MLIAVLFLKLELEAALARGVGQAGDVAVVAVAATVEDAGLDTGGLRPVGEDRAQLGCLLAGGQALEVALGPARGGQRPARVIVDQLRRKATVGAEHAQPRASCRSAHLGANAAAPAKPSLIWGLDCH